MRIWECLQNGDYAALFTTLKNSSPTTRPTDAFFLAHGWLFIVPLTTEINFRLAARQVTFSKDFFYHLSVIRSKNKIYTHLFSCYLLNIVVF